MFFENYKAAPTDPIFGLNAILKADERKDKIDLLIGYYKNEEGCIPVFDAVHQARRHLVDKKIDLNYLPIDGYHEYLKNLSQLIFPKEHLDHVFAAQTVGGTSALHHLGKIFAIRGQVKIAIPDPTWANHQQIFNYLGYGVIFYPYYDFQNNRILWDQFVEFLNNQDEGTVILLHTSCHNPSGLDFTSEQWKHIADICNKKHLFPFFDCAYQGMGRGLSQDVESIRIFAEHTEEFFLAYSCSKNFGLYGERTGALFAFSKNSKTTETLGSLFKQSIRATYSNPPRHGALIVHEILKNQELTQNWMHELESYNQRIISYRNAYRKTLELATGKDFAYVEKGNGLFIFTGLSPNQVLALRHNDAIYLSSDGRLNLTGLNKDNFEKVTSAIAKYL